MITDILCYSSTSDFSLPLDCAQIEDVNIPYQFLGMLPYLLTIIVLAGLVGRAEAPAASGEPYKSE